jgi:exosortase family protein XrtF
LFSFKVQNHPLKAVAKFLVSAFLLYILWFVFYDVLGGKEWQFFLDFTYFQTKFSVYLIKLFGFKDHFQAIDQFIFCDGRKQLRVGEECNGVVLFALFAGFVLCYPGSWKHKLWFIPLGMLLIMLANVLRISLLTINYKYYRSSFAFNHHVTFTYLVYLFIFLLWVVWVNKFGKKGVTTK